MNAFFKQYQKISQWGAAHGVTVHQMVLMLGLGGSRSTVKMSEIAGWFSVCAASVTGLVDALERKGFAERYREPSDRRQVCVRLSDKGVEVLTGCLKKEGEA